MPYIKPEEINQYTILRNGKQLDLVWDADTDKGEARIIATDMQGNMCPNPYPDQNSCPYDLLTEKGKIEAVRHTPKVDPAPYDPIGGYYDNCGCPCVKEEKHPQQLALDFDEDELAYALGKYQSPLDLTLHQRQTIALLMEHLKKLTPLVPSD